MTLLSTLLACEHPIGRHVQMMSQPNTLQPPIVLQACVDCGALRLLSGAGSQAWQRPAVVEAEMRRVVAKEPPDEPWPLFDDLHCRDSVSRCSFGRRDPHRATS
jgi:hypothetical protein